MQYSFRRNLRFSGYLSWSEIYRLRGLKGQFSGILFGPSSSSGKTLSGNSGINLSRPNSPGYLPRPQLSRGKSIGYPEDSQFSLFPKESQKSLTYSDRL